MDRCLNSECKQKLKEHRELTDKLNDDLEGFEADMRDKDKFAQKLSKERNSYESEVVKLKKKLEKLQKQNDELKIQVEQLDEDAETGLQFVRNAQERENKVKREYEEFKKDTRGVVEKVKILEKDKEEFKSKFLFLKSKMEKSLRDTQDVLTSKDEEISKMKDEVIDIKVNLENAKIVHEKAASEFKVKHDKQVSKIEELSDENDSLKQLKNDLTDELLAKKSEVEVLEEKVEVSLKSSSSSLKDELEQVHFEECDHCELKFGKKEELNSHKEVIHEQIKNKEALMFKLNKAKEKVLERKFQLTISLLNLKKKETTERQKCSCKTFCRVHFYKCDCLTYCRISHDKYRFKKPQSEEVYDKLQSLPTIINSCDQCDEDVQNISDVRRPIQCEHDQA